VLRPLDESDNVGRIRGDRDGAGDDLPDAGSLTVDGARLGILTESAAKVAGAIHLR